MSIKGIKQIWENRKDIIQGIYFKFFKFDKYVEEVYLTRYRICTHCPKIDHIGKKCEVPGTAPCCGECGCSLEIKLRALSTECPLGKWKAVMSEKLEDKLTL